MYTPLAPRSSCVFGPATPTFIKLPPAVRIQGRNCVGFKSASKASRLFILRVAYNIFLFSFFFLAMAVSLAIIIKWRARRTHSRHRAGTEQASTRTRDAICAPWRLIFKCWAAKQFLKWVSPSASSGSQSQPAQWQKFKDFIVAQNVIECNEITVQAARRKHKLWGGRTTFYAAFNCVYCLLRCVRRVRCSCCLALYFSHSLALSISLSLCELDNWKQSLWEISHAAGA